MYASTVIYWVALLLNAVGLFNVVQLYSFQNFCQLAQRDPWWRSGIPSCDLNDYGLSGTIRGMTVCAPTIILAVNVGRAPLPCIFSSHVHA